MSPSLVPTSYRDDVPHDDMPVFAVPRDNGVMYPVIEFYTKNVVVGGKPKVELVTLVM